MIPYPEIDPVALDLGVVQIRWYGISYVVGIVIAWWLLKYRSRTIRPDWTSEQIADLIFYGVIGVIVGGRLGSMLFYNFGEFAANPLVLFRIWEGGMSFHGGLLGVVIAVWLHGRSTNRTFAYISDFLVPVIPVGLGTGRIGNFINAELWGTPSQLPWAMVFPDPRAGGIPRHPTPLYECLLEGVVLFIILWVFTLKPRPAGAATGLFLALYGVFRILVEFVREPDAHIGYVAWGWLTMGQLLSIPMVLIGAWVVAAAYRNR